PVGCTRRLRGWLAVRLPERRPLVRVSHVAPELACARQHPPCPPPHSGRGSRPKRSSPTRSLRSRQRPALMDPLWYPKYVIDDLPGKNSEGRSTAEKLVSRSITAGLCAL